MQYTDVAYIVYGTNVQHRCAKCQSHDTTKHFIALCLLDHHVIGTGSSKDEALFRMMENYRKKYHPQDPPLVMEPTYQTGAAFFDAPQQE